jgi:hypothetical protein
MKMFRCLSLCLFIGMCQSALFPAYALDYPGALPNHDLGKEIEYENDRLIPKVSWFSAAADAQVYFRQLAKDDFYHGAGYWVQARTEFRPSDLFQLNVRSIFYSGSISSGYTVPTGQYNLFGFSGTLPELVFGGKLQVRAIDLERQTVGQGLIIEEKETAGVAFTWTRDNIFLKVMKDGTGGLVYGDDLTDIEGKFYNGLIGLGTLMWTAPEQSGLAENRKPAYFVNSTHSLFELGKSNMDYVAEVGWRYSKMGALFGLTTEGSLDRLRYKSRLQYRSYSDKFGKDFVGEIDNMYISYDQYNKRYTNAGNIFTKDDNVRAYSLVADLEYDLTRQITLQSKNEIGKFNYAQTADQNFYFYRLGVTYYPIPNRRESVTFFASNKVLTDSNRRPPSDYSLDKNLPLFHQVAFIGAEADFRF